MIDTRVAHHDDLEPLNHLPGILCAQEAEFSPDSAHQRDGLLMSLDYPSPGKIIVTLAGESAVYSQHCTGWVCSNVR